MIVAIGAGGGTDITARIVSQKVSEQMGVPVVVENRPGAGTIIGTEVVAKSAPDGYTLMTASPEISINPSLHAKLPYDTLKDLTAIAQLTTGQYFLSTHPSVPVKNIRDLIALAKAKPGRVTYGSSGNGSANHLGGVLFQHMTGTSLVHVPYKSAAQAATALMSGETDIMMSSTTAAIGPIKNGRLRALAVTGTSRFAGAPDVPTVAESGVPGYQAETWFGISAPAGTPQAIVDKLSAGLQKAMNSPEVRGTLESLGAVVIASNPADFGKRIGSDVQAWREIIRTAKISID